MGMGTKEREKGASSLVSGIFNFKRNFIKAHTKTPKALHGRRPFIPFPRPPRPSSSPVRRRRHAPWPSPSPSHVAYWARARARALTLREERGLEHLALSLLSSLYFIFFTYRLRLPTKQRKIVFGTRNPKTSKHIKFLKPETQKQKKT